MKIQCKKIIRFEAILDVKICLFGFIYLLNL